MSNYVDKFYELCVDDQDRYILDSLQTLINEGEIYPIGLDVELACLADNNKNLYYSLLDDEILGKMLKNNDFLDPHLGTIKIFNSFYFGYCHKISYMSSIYDIHGKPFGRKDFYDNLNDHINHWVSEEVLNYLKDYLNDVGYSLDSCYEFFVD